MNRQQALTEALDAANRAKALARRVEDTAFNGDSMGTIPRFATAAELWADTARAYAAIAAALPEPKKVESGV
ncbi:hypothetical protein [Streptomyces pseudovenezuelae]|uniref:hypothetical protein n=1 Tax=Streptomyces pseudovenezuelae TaxID=67350 RepID=UPI002E35EB5C|nr:hypothetical protein [Streptomyces pseudovenezuelae]